MISQDRLFVSEECFAVEYIIQSEMMDLFAELTGDHSSLHTNKAFARRAMYRQKVVYGMLPLVFIPMLEVCCVDGWVSALKSLTARFIKPVFVGDILRLEARRMPIQEGQNEIEFEYLLREINSGGEITSGRFVLAYSSSEFVQRESDQTDQPKRGLLIEPVTEADYLIDQITKETQSGFEFEISAKTLDLFWQLIKKGMLEQSHLKMQDVCLYFDIKNLLASLLYSTFVGMCVPGRYATFLNFTVEFGMPLFLDERYEFRGIVKHVSKMTSTIAVEATISEVNQHNAGNLAQGKINIRVNQPSPTMPSMDELKGVSNSLGFRDQVVLVTGSSRGIGETIAKIFAVHGAKVVVNYFQTQAAANQVVAEIVDAGGNAIAIKADVSDNDQVEQLVKEIKQTYGNVDILVNNAVRDFIAAPFLELAWDEFQKDIDVIIKGAFHCCQAVLPGMIAQKAGKIINISTVAAEIPPVNQSKYVTAKSGLVGLTRSLAVEFASYNVQINMVSPNFVETDLTQGMPPMFKESIKQSNPMGRLSTSVDVANAVLFLASSLSQFTTGQQIMVTGGAPPFL